MMRKVIHTSLCLLTLFTTNIYYQLCIVYIRSFLKHICPFKKELKKKEAAFMELEQSILLKLHSLACLIRP